MIKLVVNHKFAFDAANIIRLFYGKEQIETIELQALDSGQSFFAPEERCVFSTIKSEGGSSLVKASIKFGVESRQHIETLNTEAEKQMKNAVKLSLYKLLSELHHKSCPWGILTGIRPIKIIHELLDKGLDEDGIIKLMQQDYLVSHEKARLALEIAIIERDIIYPIDNQSVSIYIGIPFCPTRCHYCSFTSNSLKASGSRVDDYLEALIYEMECTKPVMNKYGLEVQTIYIGGGTPTALNELQLDRLLSRVNEIFGTDIEEFTCEAGRPDTITPEKLRIMKARGVTRISINPQSMNDETLERIGRAHNSEQTAESFKMARSLGFDNINMDIILGLPGEDLGHLEKTLEAIRLLDPDSLTVHTMAVKRASIINENSPETIGSGETTAKMMEMAAEFARTQGMRPYYLYRQKHMLENLENVGYCKPGYECIYNIQIIEEKQTNIAFGADAITKTVDTQINLIKRQGNIKDIKLYIEKIQEQITKKIGLLEELYESI